MCHGRRRRTELDTDTTATAGAEELERLFDAHYERLVRGLTVAAGSREEARDAVQEAFVQAHLRWRRIRTYDDPVGWVRRVAVNRVLNQHRSVRRGLRAIARLGASHSPPASTAAELRPELARALGRLSDRQRMAVALHHVEGLSVAETAVLMGISDGSVKTHLSRGREALRAHLEVS